MIRVTEVHAATMLAASNMGINDTTTEQQWVKGNNAISDSWEDDWSQ